MQWTPHPSWERRFTECEFGPSSLLKDKVYPVCSGPLIPERWRLPVCNQPLIPHKDEVWPVCSGPLILSNRSGLLSVQWAPYPSWEMRLIHPLCSGPLITPENGGLPSVQWAHSSLLREEVYLVCSGALIPESAWDMRSIQCAVGPSFLILPERWGLGHTQCATSPSSLRDEEYPVCNHPLIPDWVWELTLCGLNYHFYLILTYWCLQHHICYLLTLYRLDIDVY